MKQEKKGKFAVHCILCGKNFYAGSTDMGSTDLNCGGTVNGRPMCKAGDIKRAIEERLTGTKGGAA